MLASRLGRLVSRGWQRLQPALRESGPAAPELHARVAATVPLLERILRENIFAFWYPRCLDERGGYRLHLDARGNDRGPANRRLIPQARTLWLFARLARAGHRPEESLAAARHGYRFLSERMWDQRHGGFFWETDPTGTRPTISDKLCFAQTIALYALAEYAMASGETDALRLGAETFLALEQLRDPEFGGYWDRLRADWQPGGLPETLTRSPAGLKTMNAHLHALEGVTTWYAASPSPLARERLSELLRIQTSSVFRAEWGACSDAHRADWSPLLDRANARVSYGHDLENITLVLAACEALGIPEKPHLDCFRALFRSALRSGYDRRHGGFYHSGPLGAPADERVKSWWVQAEALPAALELFRLTGDAVYARCYLETLDWIVRHHVDWEYGEWHAEPPRPGKAADKAGPWKEGYHNGRAVLSCLGLAAPGVHPRRHPRTQGGAA